MDCNTLDRFHQHKTCMLGDQNFLAIFMKFVFQKDSRIGEDEEEDKPMIYLKDRVRIYFWRTGTKAEEFLSYH